MPKPRVFISSTFFDLRQVREDLERMIREMGYEPVRNETGEIPYPKQDTLESAAYREVELSEIIISIVGGRFGTESHLSPGFSISQEELKRAVERGVQVFIFIERSVLGEYSTYLLNKDSETIKYRFVDDVRVYKFIEQIHALPRNNAIAPFETATDITDYLRAQWAGLFKRFLQEEKRISEMKVLEEMQSVAATLRELVDFLTKERRDKDDAIKSILLINHPAFRRFREIARNGYRVVFTNRQEYEAWLKQRGWRKVEKAKQDVDSVEEWLNSGKVFAAGYLKITKELFERDGTLRPFTESQWNDEWVSFVLRDPEKILKVMTRTFRSNATEH